MGPVILFDKSFLEMLSVDEAAIFDFMFQSNICPIFYIETLAAALNDFYARYADDPLIVDKWLTLQATVPEPIPSVGPVILFDKSFLEMLSVDEAAIFDFMFQSNICPIFYIETLAAALNDFYARYADDPLIVDKWLTLQATVPEPATLDRVKALTNHPAFSFTNPNRVRALIHAFALANHKEFNRADGAGYDFIVDTVLTLYPKNPQVAARLLSALKSWRVLEPARRARAQAALRRVAAAPSLSPDVGDIVQRALQENQ